MRSSRIALALALALWTIGCASSGPQRDSEGLVRVGPGKPGNLFAHPSRSIDDYDDIWFAGIGIQYAEEQQPLAEPDERRVREMVYEIVLEEMALAGRLAAREAGPCTLKLTVYLAKLWFPRSGFTGPRDRGSALVISELRDSQTGEALVRYGQRRDLADAGRVAPKAPDLDQLGATLREVVRDANAAIGKSLAVNPTGARASRSCKGVVGEVRREAGAER